MATVARSQSAASQRRFYLTAAWIAAAIVLLGFAKTYYLKFAFGTPALSPLVHLHGLVMSLWIVLFLVQTQLVAAHRVDLHRRLGLAGGLLAVAVVGLGTITAITAARLGHTPGPPALIFLSVPLGDMVVFATLVGCGLALRARKDVHKRLMLLSFLGILAAAISRIPLQAIAQAGPLAYFGLTDLFIIACVAYDWTRTRRLHPAFLWGGLLVMISHPLRLLLAGTETWLRFATFLAG